MWQDDSINVAFFVNRFLKTAQFQHLAHVTVAMSLISLMWLEEMLIDGVDALLFCCLQTCLEAPPTA